MRRRKLRWVLAVLAVLFALLLVAGVLVTRPRPAPPAQINRENFDRIDRRMSRTEIYALLGPAGAYGTSRVSWGNQQIVQLDKDALDDGIVRFGSKDQWATDEARIAIHFDPDDRPDYKMWQDGTKVEQSPLERLVWWFRYAF
jgi:hypothetical protein